MPEKITLAEMKVAFGKSTDEIIEYFKKKGIETSDNWKETIELIKKNMFTISGMANMEYLMQARDIILDYMDKGINIEEMKKEFQDRFGISASHAQLVARQNISNAYNAGRYHKEQITYDLQPYVRFSVLIDKKTTDRCKYLNNLNAVYDKRDPNYKNIIPPGHFNCRRISVSLSKRQVQQRGLQIKKVSSIPKKHWNMEGFRRLPTEVFKADLDKYPDDLTQYYEGE